VFRLKGDEDIYSSEYENENDAIKFLTQRTSLHDLISFDYCLVESEDILCSNTG
jgi:hypothetical protein